MAARRRRRPGGVAGPTGSLTLHTLALAARTGPREWHLADLAGIHGVTNIIMRNALDRLAYSGWLADEHPGPVWLRPHGTISRNQLARLHPIIAD